MQKESPQSQSPASAAGPEPPWPDPRYGWYVVSILMLAYAFSYLDRMILALLIGPVRRDLGISDTEVSILIGFAFAAFYTLMGLPLGLIADRSNRRNLVAAGIAVWSLMTAACGLAQSFWTLFLARIGVGVGEATLSPAAYSMLSDYFPRHRLARVMAVYSVGATAGIGVAMMIGGAVVSLIGDSPPRDVPLLGTLHAWQLTFLWVGLPGLLVAALMFTVREPLRRGAVAAAAMPQKLPFADLWNFMRKHPRTYIGHMGGVTLLVFAVFAYMTWTFELFGRTWNMDRGEIGLYYGLIMLVFGSGGLVAGGIYADYLFARGIRDGHMRAVRLSVIGTLPCYVLAPLMPSPWLALALLAPATFFQSVQGGVAGAALQLITPNRLRAQIIAVFFFAANIIGLGLGPTAVAVITDYVFADDGALRYSMAIVSIIVLPASIAVLSWGLKPFRDSLDAADAGWPEAQKASAA